MRHARFDETTTDLTHGDATGLGVMTEAWMVPESSPKWATLGGGGKILCEILTAVDAIPLSVADLRVDQNLSRHGSVRPPLQRGGNRSGAGCRGVITMPFPCRLVVAKNHAICHVSTPSKSSHTLSRLPNGPVRGS